jgi:hypothetical protein
LTSAAASTSVGVLREGHLHATLRENYLQPGDQVEAAVDGYLVDVLRPGLIIEVQTSSFAKIARKLRDLVSRHRVRLVHPVPRDRWIVKLPQDPGGTPTRRKSPNHLDPVDVFRELVSFPELITHENFELDVVLTEEENVRRYDGRRGWRRRGWVTVERRLVRVIETLPLRCAADYAALLPDSLCGEFQTADLATALRRPRHVAQKAAYCLRHGGLIEKVGSKGNAVLYSRVNGIEVATTVDDKPLEAEAPVVVRLPARRAARRKAKADERPDRALQPVHDAPVRRQAR